MWKCINGHTPEEVIASLPSEVDPHREMCVMVDAKTGKATNHYWDGIVGVVPEHVELAEADENPACPECQSECDWVAEKWVERKDFRKRPRTLIYELGFNLTGGISGNVSARLSLCEDGSLWVDGRWYHFYGNDIKQRHDEHFEVITRSVCEANALLVKAIEAFKAFALANGTTPYAKPAVIDYEVTGWARYHTSEEFQRNYPWRDDAHTH